LYLYERINTYKDIDGAYKNLPQFIVDNLTPEYELRPYQKEAFQNFITYFENTKICKKPVQNLFHMATGSGKTVIMAGLISYLYQKGYRNFLFFVNSDNIIKKTKENFLNSASIKYLFNKEINIDGEYVKINEVNNFQDYSEKSINICFTTIQGLHSRLTKICENSLSFDDFEDKKLVLIADEAHHLNVQTRKNAKNLSEEEKIEQNWETTINSIFDANQENVLLEFTATCDLQNENIRKSYEDKIIMDYPLKSFRNDKYSKEVETLSVELEREDRILQAVLLSQYRLKLFQDNKIIIKPVIMLKHKTIKESEQAKEDFSKFIQNLTIQKIAKIKTTSTAPIIKRMFEYFDKNVQYESLIQELKEDFSEEKCISVNDDKETKSYQIQINTLEDKNNLIRCVFAVNKLNEGWDVLNLFDIVRLYETRSAKPDGTPEKQTIQEAQLIGRGARYCPFKISEGHNKFTRKFDNDLDNDLRVCETLYYHCQHNPLYIRELKRAMREVGIMDGESTPFNYKLKESFKTSDFYENGLIFENEQELQPRKNLVQDFPYLKNQPFLISIPSGASSSVILLDDNDNNDKNENVAKYQKLIDFSQISYSILHKAIRQFPTLEFSNLKKKYENLKSTREFLINENFLGNIQIAFVSTNVDNISIEQYYNACKAVLNKVSSLINQKEEEFKGTYEFKPKKLKEVIKDKSILISKTEADGRGLSQKDCSEEELRLNLENEDWYVFNDNYGTTEEKYFVVYFKNYIEDLKKQYENVFLIRNERQLKLFSFDEGKRFEPDFVLFLQKKKEQGYQQYQVFIEPKGSHLIEKDAWKEKFLLEIKEKHSIKTFINNNDCHIWGFPFYNRSQRGSQFKEAMESIK